MIFVLAEEEPTLFVMLVESDIPELRRGLTKFVDHRHIKSRTFNRVVLSLHKDKDEIMKVLRQIPGGDKKMVEGGPLDGEAICKFCKGTHLAANMFEDGCIVCWATKAKEGVAKNISIKPV